MAMGIDGLHVCALVAALGCTGCASPPEIAETKQPEPISVPVETTNTDTQAVAVSLMAVSTDTVSELEESLILAGLVNIQAIEPNLLVELKYSTTDNFLGVDLYGPLVNCYLQPDVAEKLALAQSFLAKERPGYRLLVYDGVRPRSIQQLMWESLDTLPVAERVKYVSNPAHGSLHNFGAAVDLTIADSTGQPLDMGTPYDYFGELAYPRREWELVKEGKLLRAQVDNRSLLRAVMVRAGFWGIQTEWWHFNSCTRMEAKEQYTIVE